MLPIKKIIALLVLLSVTSAFAQSDESEEAVKIRSGSGDPVAGKEKSYLCQGCHGEKGISLEPLIPHLAGQYAGYIAKEVRNYQSGTRSHAIMNAMAGTIDRETDLADIGAYFASQQKMQGNRSGDNPVGMNLFTKGDMTRNTFACMGCHGPNGKGSGPKSSMYPVIGGQQKEYVRKQLTNFRDGWRTNSPSNIMNTITQKLTDAEIDALAEYVSVQ